MSREYDSIQYEVVPYTQPLPEPYVVEVFVCADENDVPMPEHGTTKVLTIPVRRGDLRLRPHS